MTAIDIPSAGSPVLDTWGASVADAINYSLLAEGWVPYAYPIGFDARVVSGTQTTLNTVVAGEGGIIFAPIALDGPMAIQSITLRSGDTSNARLAEAALYRDTGSTTLDRVSGTYATWSFTPSAASDRTANVATPGTILQAGVYWVAIRNTSTVRDFIIRRSANSTELASNQGFQDLTPNATALTASTFDLTTLAITKLTGVPMVRLDGRVFGESSAF